MTWEIIESDVKYWMGLLGGARNPDQTAVKVVDRSVGRSVVKRVSQFGYECIVSFLIVCFRAWEEGGLFKYNARPHPTSWGIVLRLF